MTKNNILNAISELKNIQGGRISKYRRNYRYYNYTIGASLENMKDPTVVGYNNYREFGEEEDTTLSPQLNVIASCIDTLTSKIAQSKVRPFFNTLNGTFADIQAVKQAQQFFDVMFDMQNVNKTVSEAFRDACIFDTGVIYVDDESGIISKALPFQVYARPAEVAYNKLTRVFYERKDFPTTLLPEKIYNKFKNKTLDYIDFGIYYDIKNKVKAYTANGSFVCQQEYNHEYLPFVFMYYKNPIVGNSSTSVVDILYTIQQEINVIMAKIKDASQLNPALTFLVPEGSNLKAQKLNNRVGNIITYKPQVNGGLPVTSSTPAFIDNQYSTLLNDLIQKSYELVGISQLSAMSKKPTGLDSGIALSTMENVESDRFETQVTQVIRTYVDIAKTCINVFDENAEILPLLNNRVPIKWKDIIKESNNMSIQYSAADSLSKDPSTKLQQLQQLAQAGVIPLARISQLMEIPDLEMGYSLSNNAIDAVMEIIKECIEEGNFDIPEYIPFDLLKEEIINTQLSLRAANKDGNKEDIIKLSKLYEKAEDLAMQWQLEAEQDNVNMQNENNTNLPYNKNILEREAAMTKVNDIETMPEAGRGETQDNAAWINNNDFDRA